MRFNQETEHARPVTLKMDKSVHPPDARRYTRKQALFEKPVPQADTREEKRQECRFDYSTKKPRPFPVGALL